MKKLRAEAGNLTKESVRKTVKESRTKPISIKSSDVWREKYFAGMEKKQIMEVIGEALDLWAAGKEAV